jgi:hypothetical protein
VARQFVECGGLLLSQGAEKTDGKRRPRLAAVFGIGLDAIRTQEFDSFVEAPARKGDMIRALDTSPSMVYRVRQRMRRSNSGTYTVRSK